MKKVVVSDLLALEKNYAVAWSVTEKSAFKRLAALLADRKKVATMKVVRGLVDLGLTSIKKDLSFFCKLLTVLGWSSVEVEWLKAAGIEMTKKITYKKRDTVFPDKEVFQNNLSFLLGEGKAEAALFVAATLASGRRGVEVSRLTGENLAVIDGKLVAKLDWSKTSVKPICFQIDFEQVSEWLEPVLSVAKVRDAMASFIDRPGSVFAENIHKNIGKRLGFSLHALRSIKAIFMLVGGFEDKDIKNQLGWTDDRMLLRYVRMDPRIVKGQMSVEQALEIVQRFSK